MSAADSSVTSKIANWMGSPPTHWKVVAIKNITSVMRGASPRPIEDTRYFDDDGEYGWVRIADVTRNHQYLSNTEQRLSKLGQSLSVELEPNSLFLSIAGSVGKPMITKIKACIHDGFVYFPQLENESNKFLFYIFDSGQPYKGLGKLGTQLNLNTDTVGSIKIPFPPLPTQQKIADFLDRKTAQIDALIEKKRLLIEKLKEKRLAVITQAVTRGLNPHAPLKDSGIQWLGKVPEHWEVRRLKDYGKLAGGSGFPYDFQGIQDELLPFYKVGDLKLSKDDIHLSNPLHTVSYETAELLRTLIIPKDSIVYAKIGAALLLNRRRITTRECCIDNNMTAYIPDKTYLNPFWVYYWMSILDFGGLVNPGAVPSFSEGYQSTLPILVPDKKEQVSIVDYIFTETKQIEHMLFLNEQTIDRLTEYRTVLITAAVTGQLEVA